MNKQQRARLGKIVEQLYDLQSQIEEVKDEEESKYDNLPESLQDSDKGESFLEAIDSLEDSLSYLSDAIDSLEFMN